MESIRKISFELIAICNKVNYCPYCYYELLPHTHVKKNQIIPLMNFEKVITKIQEYKLKNVNFSGGEPLLVPDLEEYVPIAQRVASFARVITNTDLLSIHKMKALYAKGLKAIDLSLNELTYNPNLNFDEYLDKYKNTILVLKNIGYNKIGIIVVVSKLNLPYLLDVLDLAREMDIDIYLQPVFVPWDQQKQLAHLIDYHNHDLKMLIEGLNVWADKDWRKRYISIWLNTIIEHKKPDRCMQGIDSFLVCYNGKVAPCYHRRDLYCGNIFSDDIDEIFKKLKSSYRSIENADCYEINCKCTGLYGYQVKSFGESFSTIKAPVFESMSA